MLPISIRCGCGQIYDLEVEPLNGQLPGTVACPGCGTDGTAAANAILTQKLKTFVATPGTGLRLSTPAQPQSPASARPRPGRQPGQVDPDQAIMEANAQISWGDSPKQVTGYLMSQGFTYEDASQMVMTMFDDRAAAIRKTGFTRILSGVGLLCLAGLLFVTSLAPGRLRVGFVVVMVLIGACGIWSLAKGILLVATPRTEDGDIAEK